mmetsp:Transcript_47504/g.152547  ORF Transcript_47504/g.152547 Transcript_47504/m.152547 type:complete len:226 (-) Transcript_47504:3913-4590(-)
MLRLHRQPRRRDQPQDQDGSAAHAACALWRSKGRSRRCLAFVGPSRGQLDVRLWRGFCRSAAEVDSQLQGYPLCSRERGWRGVLEYGERGDSGLTWTAAVAFARHDVEEHGVVLGNRGLHGTRDEDGHELPQRPIKDRQHRADHQPSHDGRHRRTGCDGIGLRHCLQLDAGQFFQVVVPFGRDDSVAELDLVLAHLLRLVLELDANLSVCDDGGLQLCTGLLHPE